jgi:acetyl esterase/lipase
MRINRHVARVVAAGVVVLTAVGCDVNNPKSADLLPKKLPAALTPAYDDVPFGSLPSQTLDMYAPVSRKNGGTLVWLHGGGWDGGTADEITPIVQWLVRERGWTLLTVDYRMTDEAPFPAALEDAKLAIRWAKVNGPEHGLDPERVFVMGWSAGGQLAALAATTDGEFEPTDIPESLQTVSSRPAGAVSLSGPLDPMTFATSGDWNIDGNRRSTSKLLGCTDGVTIDNCPILGADVAPARWADKNDAPIYIASGDLDPIVDLQTQALNPSDALITAMGANKVWIDVVDSGPVEYRAHTVDFGMNRWALEQFFKWGPTF